MIEKTIKKCIQCRICKHHTLTKVFGLGPTPLANSFLTTTQTDLPELYYPLDVCFCTTCSFVQLGHVVSPKILFKNYIYVSSTSVVLQNHFKDYAKHLIQITTPEPQSLFVDIGSNDGTLLKPIRTMGFRVLGVEPAHNIAQIAQNQGIDTVCDFFNVAVAQKIARTHGRATAITANNVFAHIDNLDEIMNAVEVLLDDNGVFVIEAPHLVDLIKKNLFDTIYHEHLSYLALTPLLSFFKHFHMKIIDVLKTDSQGGSIRIFVTRKQNKNRIESKRVRQVLEQEKKVHIASRSTYDELGKRIQKVRTQLLTLLSRLKAQGKTIAGYGAPAKGNTLLNFFSIGTEILDFIVDDSPHKQGLYTPGKHIPVVAPTEIYRKKPDYLLILAWNFAPSIIKNHQNYQKRGGTFIVPLPRPKVISP